MSGKVVDAATGEGIPSFKIILGFDYGQGQLSWRRARTIQGRAGTYSLPVQHPDRDHALRVEAKGYAPMNSRVFRGGEGDTVFDFALERSEDVEAVVLDPGGVPVVGAKAYLSDARMTVRLENGQFAVDNPTAFEYSDEDGRVSFVRQDRPYGVIVVHDAGFARAMGRDIERYGKIHLEAWGRVEGVARIGADPAAGAWIDLQSLDLIRTRVPPRVTAANWAQTDSDGRFAIDRVLAGDVTVGRRVELWQSGDTTAYGMTSSLEVFLMPGATMNVAVGGEGRPVVGHFVAPEGHPDSIGWSHSERRVTKLSASSRGAGPVRHEGILAIVEPSHSKPKESMWFTYSVDDAGAFRIEDVPPGDYHLALYLNAPTTGGYCPPNAILGSAEIQFDVPPIAGGRSDKPLDIGAVAVTMRDALAVGEPAPPLDVDALGAGRINLADYKGKVVLLDFWATWCGPCIAEMPTLKAVYETYKDHPDFAIVGLSLDSTKDAPRSMVNREGLAWDHGFLGNWNSTPLPSEFGVYGIPATMVIGPGGRVLARDLRGKAIAEAVSEALEVVE